jgi:hypothetical protein
MVALLILAATAGLALAQVDTAWVRRYDGPIHQRDAVTCASVDHSGNAYVAGPSYYYSHLDTTLSDFVTIKYRPSGDTAWLRRLHLAGDSTEEIAGLVVDRSGGVYVAGYVYVDSGLYIHPSLLVLKYDSLGVLEWRRTYGGTRKSWCAGIALDSSGSVVVVGTIEYYTSYNFLIVKYRANGDTAWVREYAGPMPGLDRACGVAVGTDNSVVVAGYGTGVGTHFDFEVVRYDSSGHFLWDARADGMQNNEDRANGMAVDAAGNTYVVGWSEFTPDGGPDMFTVKFTADGRVAWARAYAGPTTTWDEATAVAADSLGHVYSVGYITADASTLQCDLVVLCYDDTGHLLWSDIYAGMDQGWDQAAAVAVFDTEFVVVTGFSDCIQTGCDYLTIWYRPCGETLACRRYNGWQARADVAMCLALGGTGGVVVAGMSNGVSNSGYDMATVAYSPPDAVTSPDTASRAGSSCDVLPNPTRGGVEIRLPAGAGRDVEVRDAAGRSVAIVTAARGASSCRLDLVALSPGVYFVQVRAGGVVSTARVVLTR